jgi:hypothetical protein
MIRTRTADGMSRGLRDTDVKGICVRDIDNEGKIDRQGVTCMSFRRSPDAIICLPPQQRDGVTRLGVTHHQLPLSDKGNILSDFRPQLLALLNTRRRRIRHK